MNKILKLFGVIFACLIIYYRPFYILWFVLILFYEYLWFIHFLINIYNNYTKYYIIEIEEIDISDKNTIEVWIEYCKLQAFQRLYILLSKNKRISFSSILKASLIILLGIPFKFLNLSYYFLFKNQENFRINLYNLYFNSYYNLKHCKIEILNKKIYLNCFTVGKLCKKLLNTNALTTEENFLKGVKALKQQMHEFDKFEKDNIELKLIEARDKNNNLVFRPHYGWKEGSSTGHGTSNIPSFLYSTQSQDVVIPGLIKFGAKNPGTIITREITKIFTLNKTKIVKKMDVESIKYNYPELFKQDKEIYGYVNAKHMAYESILREYFKWEKNIDAEFMKELRTNLYCFILLNNQEKIFIEEYKIFYKDREL